MDDTVERDPDRGARCALAALAVIASFALGARPVAGQITPDSTSVAGDTLAAPDSVTVEGGTAQEAQDSVPADTIYYNLPRIAGSPPSGFPTAVWEWDHEAILVSNANTLAELVAQLPGVIQLLGGDYGTPAALSAFGSGAGGVRIFRDGFEVSAMAGGVADLQRISLGGIVHVRLERRGGEMVIELTSYRYEDARPFTLVEAGTGQLDTNLFRGTFATPSAIAGSLAFSLDRVDTRGYGENEGGSRTGFWLRYQVHSGDRGGLSVDVNRMTSKTEVEAYASSVARTDLSVRGSFEIVDGLVAEAYSGRSTHDVKDSREQYGYEGGTRSQHGLRLGGQLGGLWGRGAVRFYEDDDRPTFRIEGSGGFSGQAFGVHGNASQSRWGQRDVFGFGVGGWAGPFSGVTVFGSWDGGQYAGRSAPVRDELPPPVVPLPPPESPPVPGPHVMERSLLRAGASATRWGVTIAGAGLRAEANRHVPLELELDRGSLTVVGAVRYGVEASASVPLPVLEGLGLEGSYQQWDLDGPYLPRRIYRAAFVFHRTYLESGNFELWATIGVRGHDPSSVFVAEEGFAGLATVPFYQNWYGHVTARILSVRLFFTWDNFAIRRNLQNFPGRLQPPTRSFFGLRWDLWD